MSNEPQKKEKIYNLLSNVLVIFAVILAFNCAVLVFTSGDPFIALIGIAVGSIVAVGAFIIKLLLYIIAVLKEIKDKP